MSQAYIAGHMLTRGAQLQRALEKEEIQGLGYKIYNPMDNKEINDKANLDNNEGLAEKIVRQDTHAILASDKIVIEPLPEACGTMVELGQIKGMKDFAKVMLDVIANEETEVLKTLEEKVEFAKGLCQNMIDKEVLPHYEDIRRFKGVTETEDRRSLGINQYVYGVCLDLTSGKGFYEWDEVLQRLEKVRPEQTSDSPS